MLLVLPNFCPRFYHISDDLENQLKFLVYWSRKPQTIFKQSWVRNTVEMSQLGFIHLGLEKKQKAY